MLMYVLYDGRGSEDGCVMTTANNLSELRKDSAMFPEDCVWYSYQIRGEKPLQKLVNETRLGNIAEINREVKNGIRKSRT